VHYNCIIKFNLEIGVILRTGSYPEGSLTETVIDVWYFDGDILADEHPLKKYKEGVWVTEAD
jgi:hypothetical protein